MERRPAADADVVRVFKRGFHLFIYGTATPAPLLLAMTNCLVCRKIAKGKSHVKINEDAHCTKCLEGKSSRIGLPKHLTFVSILLDPKSLNDTN